MQSNGGWFRRLFSKIGKGLRNFMQGRYGSDKLNTALLLVGIGFCVLAMFFGLTDAACEILRDRPLLRRESNYRLFTSGYLTAKVLVLTGIAGLQCALYLLVGHAILGIHYMFWEHFAVMLLTAFVGIALSLMVSAFVRSDRTALNIVPLLLVPQILLAGALIRFEEMNEFSPRIPEGIIPAAIDKRLSYLRHRVAYQHELTLLYAGSSSSFCSC